MEVQVIGANPRKQIKSNGLIENVKKRVCAYCRVSTDYEDQLTSYRSQISHYSDLIKKNPDWIFAGVYADEGITGTQIKHRDQFIKMIEDCKNKKIDMIVAKSISRFARNTVDTLNTVRLLRNLNIDVWFEKENIHTINMDSEMFLTLYSAFAQAESESTSQNVKLGYNAKMKRGEPCGQPACYGYNWDPVTKKLSINEDEAKVVRKIFELYLDGVGTSRICNELKKYKYKTPKGGDTWHPSVIKDMLRNEKYVGDLCGQKFYVISPLNHKQVRNRGDKPKYYVKDHHDPIIERDVFDKAQEIYEKRSIILKDGKEYCEKFSMRYTLSSRITCGNCGSKYVRRVTHYTNKLGETHEYVYWVCSGKNAPDKKCNDRISIRESELNEMFMELFNKLKDIYETGNLIEKIEKAIDENNVTKEMIKLDRKEKDIDLKISKLLDMKLSSNIDEETLNKKYDDLKLELENINMSKQQLKAQYDYSDTQKNQLKKIEEQLNTNKMSKYNDDVFKKMIKEVIIGGYEENNEYNPSLVNFIFNVNFRRTDDLGSNNSFAPECEHRFYKTIYL